MNERAYRQPDSANDASDTLTMDDALAKPFDSAPIQGDQRQSYRYPAQAGREDAQIRRGGKLFAAKLVEESAGGIALEVAKDLKLTSLEQIEVGIYSGWYVARVIHARPIEGGQRIGLQRIVVLSSDDGEKSNKRGGRNASGISKLAIFFIAGTAMLAGVGLTSWFNKTFGKNSFVGGATIASTYAEKPRNDKLKHMLDSVNILNNPEIAVKLQLTPQQKKSFEGVLVGASNRLGAAYEESKNQSPDVWYAKSQGIINDAIENILCSMTDRQIVQWRRVLLEKRQAPPAADRVSTTALPPALSAS